MCNLTSIFFKVRLKLKITLIDNLKIWKLFCNIFKAPPLTIWNILPNSWWQTTQHDDKNFFSSVNYSLASNQSNQLSSWQHKKNLYITLNKKKKTSWYVVIMEMFVLEILILERYLGTLMNMVLCGSRDIWGLWWTWFFVVCSLGWDIFETLMNNWWFFYVLWMRVLLPLSPATTMCAIVRSQTSILWICFI